MCKSRMTIKEHKALGKELKVMQDRLSSIYVQIANSYPVKAKVVGRVRRIKDALAGARSELDRLVFQEHGGEATPRIYYGEVEE